MYVENINNISGRYINATKQLYIDVTACIELGEKVIRQIAVSKGMKQCCCIVQTLFKIYLNETIRHHEGRSIVTWVYRLEMGGSSNYILLAIRLHWLRIKSL